MFISYVVSGQEIAGKWYSRDSMRIYHVYKNDDQYEAILEKSSRKSDREGVIILRHVLSRKKNRGYEGEIYSVDGISTFAKITVKQNGQVLRFRLRRMFIMNVTMKWYRVEEKTMTLLL